MKRAEVLMTAGLPAEQVAAVLHRMADAVMIGAGPALRSVHLTYVDDGVDVAVKGWTEEATPQPSLPFAEEV